MEVLLMNTDVIAIFIGALIIAPTLASLIKDIANKENK